MKALLLTYAYPPMRYPRAIQISRLVKHLNCTVDVVCCNELNARPDLTLPARFERNPRQIFRFNYKPRASRLLRKLLNIFAIPDVFLGWSLSAARAVASNTAAPDYDVVVSFGQPMSNHLAGLFLKRKFGLPWLAHFSDPWADNPYHGKNFLRRWINRTLERVVVNASDKVVFTSELTLKLVMKKYPPTVQGKAEVLPHAFDPEMYPKVIPRRRPLIIRHLGNFYPPRTPVPFLEAITFLHKRSPELLEDVCIEFIGEISSRIRINRQLMLLPPGLVAFIPAVDYGDSLRLMAESSLLVVIDAPFDTGVFLPSKLIDYLGACVPILAVSPLNGTTASVVRKYGGVVAGATDISDIAEKLSKLLADMRQGGVDRKLSLTFRQHFHAAKVAADFEQILAAMLAPHRK